MPLPVVEHEAGDGAVASLGASLELETEDGHREVFHLVGTHEADILENRISDDSRFGQSLVGKRAGDNVVLPSNRGQTVYRVVSVSYD